MKAKYTLHRRVCHYMGAYPPAAIWSLWKNDQCLTMTCMKTTSSSFLDKMMQKVFGYKPISQITDSMRETYTDIRFLWTRGYGRKSSFWKEVLYQKGEKESLELLRGKLEVYKFAEKMKGGYSDDGL